MREGRLDVLIHQFLELQGLRITFFLFNVWVPVRSSEVKFDAMSFVGISNDYRIDFKGSTKQDVIAAELGEGDTLWKEVV